MIPAAKRGDAMKKCLWVLLIAMALPACAKNKKSDATADCASQSEFTTVFQSAADASSEGEAIEPGCSSCEESWERGMALNPPAYEDAGAPAGTDALASELRGRHVETVPRREELLERAHAEAQLQYLAENGAMLVERQRALSLLRHFPSAATRTQLLRIASDEKALLPLRSAALRSLHVIASSDDVEAQEVLDAARRSPEPRIRASVGASDE